MGGLLWLARRLLVRVEVRAYSVVLDSVDESGLVERRQKVALTVGFLKHANVQLFHE